MPEKMIDAFKKIISIVCTLPMEEEQIDYEEKINELNREIEKLKSEDKNVCFWVNTARFIYGPVSLVLITGIITYAMTNNQMFMGIHKRLNFFDKKDNEGLGILFILDLFLAGGAEFYHFRRTKKIRSGIKEKRTEKTLLEQELMIKGKIKYNEKETQTGFGSDNSSDNYTYPQTSNPKALPNA
jgi:hypothetical protein